MATVVIGRIALLLRSRCYDDLDVLEKGRWRLLIVERIEKMF